MNVIELESEMIERSLLESISSDFVVKLEEIESHLLQTYEEYIEWMSLTEEQLEEFKEDFLKNLSFHKIDYPKGKPVLISNAKDGNFEYGYELNVIEDISINSKIETKVSLGDVFSTYLFQKENNEEPSFLFLYECIGDSGERTDNIFIVEY